MEQPKIRFKGFDDEWKREKLESIANITRGASPRPIKDPKWFNKNSNVGWLRISDVTSQNGRIRFIKQKLSKLGENKTRVLKEPTVLLSIAASVGYPAINYVNTGVHDGFLIFNDLNLDKEFLFQWFINFRKNWKKYSQPGSQLNLNSNLVSNQNISIPSLKEQTRISHYFKLIDQMINLHQSKLKHLKQLKKGYLQKMFTSSDAPRLRFKGFNDNWQKQNLNNISKTFSGGTPKVSNKLFYNGNIPFIRSSEIHKNSTELTITEKGLENSSAKLVHRGTILYALYGATSGQVDLSKISGAINQAILAIQLDNQNNNEFIVKILERLKKKIVATYLQGGQGNLSAKIIKNIYIKIPSLPEQTKIGHFFTLLDKQIELANQKLLSLQKAKKAYLQKMFI